MAKRLQLVYARLAVIFIKLNQRDVNRTSLPTATHRAFCRAVLSRVCRSICASSLLFLQRKQRIFVSIFTTFMLLQHKWLHSNANIKGEHLLFARDTDWDVTAFQLYAFREQNSFSTQKPLI